MNAGQNNRARIWMARSQIVKKILSEVRNSIDIQNEQFWLYSEDELLRLLQTARHLDQRVRRGLVQHVRNGRGQLLVRFQNQDPRRVF